MPITFHCPKCGKHIKAPDGSGGNHAPCPSCHQDVYIPVPMEELDTIDLAPIDEQALAEEERLLQQSRDQAAELRKAGIHTGGEESTSSQSGALAATIHRWVLHMSAGELDQAEELRERILRQRPKAEKIVQQIMSDEIPPDALSAIPRPVLNGLLRQLLSDAE